MRPAPVAFKRSAPGWKKPRAPHVLLPDRLESPPDEQEEQKMSDELQRHKHHGDDEHEPDVEAHRHKHRTDDGESSDEPDVEAHRHKHRHKHMSDDGESSDEPDV